VTDSLTSDMHYPADNASQVSVYSGIEFEFNSSELSLEAFEKAFTISPEVPMSFYREGLRYIAAPQTQFEHAVSYTVKLDSRAFSKAVNMELDKDIVFTFTTMTEEESMGQYDFYPSVSSTVNVLSDEVPMPAFFIDTGILQKNPKIEAVVYSMTSDEYVKKLNELAESKEFYSERYISVDTTAMQETMSFTSSPIAINSNEYFYRNSYGIPFPEKLPKGWYAVKFTLPNSNISRFVLLQVTDLSVYTMSSADSGGSVMAWIHNTVNGTPANNAFVCIDGDIFGSANTKEDGVCIFNLNSSLPTKNQTDYSTGLLTVKFGSEFYADINHIYTNNTVNTHNNYTTYLYTDREIYRTSDTINVFGIVQPRYKNTPKLSTVTLTLEDAGFSKDIKLDDNGTFTAKIAYDNIPRAYSTNLELKNGSEKLYSTFLSIQDYSKPPYSITVSDKPVYRFKDSDKMEIEIEVTSYDGTPASNFTLNTTETWGDSNAVFESDTVITDKNGRAKAYLAVVEDYDSWRPATYSYRVTSAQAEDEYSYEYTESVMLHRDVMLTGEVVTNKESVSVNVQTNRLIIKNIKDEHDIWNYENLKGEPIRRDVTAELHKEYYEKVEKGQVYDSVTRESVPQYEYIQHDDIVNTFKFETLNGKYTLDSLPLSTKDESYYLILTSRDTQQERIDEKVYLGSWLPYRGFNSNSYSFEAVQQNTPSFNTLYQRYDSNPFNQKNSFADDEAVSFRLMHNNEQVDGSGKLLYMTVQSGLGNYTVTDKTEFEIAYNEKLLPNYILAGAYFDGRTVHSVDDLFMKYDYSSHVLNITLSADKESYAPGDDAVITAFVTDYSGKPAKNAQVLLSSADEAVFTLAEQDVDLPAILNRPVYYPMLIKYSSQDNNPETAGGKGGGSTGAAREFFADTAFFGTAKTNADGKAVFSFKLPDNITQWRLTSLALSDKNSGSTKNSARSTLPYFVQPIVSRELLEGDTFTVGLRSRGTQIDPESIAEYKVVISDDNEFKKTLSGKAAADEYTFVDISGLNAGDYYAEISGKCGAYSDSVKLPFSVVPSGIELSLSKNFDIESGELSVNASRYPVAVSVYNKNAQLYYDAVSYLLENSRTQRTDSIIAKLYLSELFPETGKASDELNTALRERAPYGIYRAFPNGEFDAKLTAKALLAAPDICKPPASIDYLEFDMPNSEALLLAAAIQGNDVCSKSEKLLENSSLSFDAKINLICTLKICGEDKAAVEQYNKLVKPFIKEITGISGDTALYVDLKDESGSFLKNTAAALTAAALLDLNESDGLLRYLLYTESNSDIYPLEVMMYLQNADYNNSKENKFSYTLNGKTVEQTIKGNERSTLKLTKEQLDSCKFTADSNELTVQIFYQGAPDGNCDPSLKKIGLVKTITPVDGKFKAGSLVKITIVPDFSGVTTSIGTTELIVEDYLPSGMRFEEHISSENQPRGIYSDLENHGWNLALRQGQRVTFNIYNADIEGGISPITYYARCTSPGTYINESAYIVNTNGSIWGCSPRSEITITEK
ncbi:MAG: hypothetical protein IKV41_03650, partial [Oscillospiraceae bacterium]|nr:hypothetical protein [Oscillospiraceae bacterium]